MGKKAMLLILCVMAIMGVCVVFQPADAAEKAVKEKDWDTLVYALQSEPDRLDPHTDSLLPGVLMCKQLYNTLVVRSAVTGEIEPSLATKWEWRNDKTLIMNLRDDVYFHNGDKFTAEDVLFSLKRICNGNATATMFKAFDSENSKVLDEHTIEIRMKETYAPAISLLACPRGIIINKKYTESVDEVTFSRQPVGTGPFKFSSWTTGDNVTLVKNDEYWGNKPSFTNLIFRIITENGARAIEVETGGVDIAETLLGDDISRYMNNEAPEVKVYTKGGVRIHWLAFNEDDPILANEKVRQAFACAIDPTQVVDVAFGLGRGAALATSSVATSVLGYQAQPARTVDIEKGRKLLAEAGYPDGFTCTLVIPESVHNIRMGEAMQAQLQEIGINMEINPVTAATWMSMSRDGSAKLSIQNLSVDSLDPDQAYSSHYSDSANKVVRTYDETVNRLLVEGRNELDNAKRLAIYSELQKYIYDHAIQIDLDEPLVNWAARDYIEGLIPDPAALLNLSTITINH